MKKYYLVALITILLGSCSTLKQRCDCSNIEIKVDEFTGDKTYSIDMGHTYTGVGYTTFEKVIHKTSSTIDTAYYLTLCTFGRTCVVGKKGVIVIFTDGTKWEKQEQEIDEAVHSTLQGDWRDFRYTAFIRLEKNDLNLFSTKIISKFRLYIFDSEQSNFIMNVEDTYIVLNSLINCIIKVDNTIK